MTKLKKWRLDNNLLLREAAELLGLNFRTYQRYELPHKCPKPIMLIIERSYVEGGELKMM